MEESLTASWALTQHYQIYDLRLERFQCDLEDDHPSLDGSVKKTNAQTGADEVTQQLDIYNLKYQRLCESLRDKLKELGEKSPDDPDIQVKFTSGLSYNNKIGIISTEYYLSPPAPNIVLHQLSYKWPQSTKRIFLIQMKLNLRNL